MKYSELAYRYASALFEIATEAGKTEPYFTSLSSVTATLHENEGIARFIESPLVRASDKVETLSRALEKSGLPQDVLSFILLLAKKERLALLPEIVAAYQSKQDEASGVTRGTVRAAKELTPAQKENLTKTISEIMNKKVSLQYVEDKSLIGGLVAQVGSYTFDDTLSTHLQRIKEDLTRRIN